MYSCVLDYLGSMVVVMTSTRKWLMCESGEARFRGSVYVILKILFSCGIFRRQTGDIHAYKYPGFS